MRILILLLALSMGFLKSWAGDAPYPVEAIPEALLKNAHIVKRAEEITFEVLSTDKTVYHYKYAFTVLDEAGDDYVGFIEWYDKLRKIQSLEGRLYDASGKLVKRTKEKDFQDQSAVDNNSLMTDSRKKEHHFYCKVYPYTVEYEAEVVYNNTYSFPSWTPQEYQHQSVEKSQYTLICPSDYNVRYRMFNYTGEPQQTVEKGKKSYRWQLQQTPAIEREYAGPRWQELTTSVLLAPTAFEIEGYKGVMSSWQEFGKFFYTLNKDRDQLPAGVLQQVKGLVQSVSNDAEKVRILYEYLQQTTRYISIQLGIGGMQPFAASDVAQKGYGDCKALSNYMFSLLKAAGIRSHYALINSGRTADDKFIVSEFIYDPFDHVILCVPLQRDTIWLECTSQTTAAGYMGDFTGNRKALLVTEKGGALVNTPCYNRNENLQYRSLKGKIDADGNLQFNAITSYKAIQQDNLNNTINYLSNDKVKEVLNEDLGLSTYNINTFAYKQKKEELPEIDEELDITVAGYATITGKRLFITPNVLNRSHSKLSIEERLSPIQFGIEYRDVDSIEIEVPEGYQPEAIPQPVTLKNKFGSYSSNATYVGNKIVYVRTREQFAGAFPATDYNDLVSYYEAIYKSDRSRLVLKKVE